MGLFAAFWWAVIFPFLLGGVIVVLVALAREAWRGDD